MWIPSDSLLAEYLAERCSEADGRAIERWTAADPANRARLKELEIIWKQPWPPVSANVDKMWAGVQGALSPDRGTSRAPIQTPRPSRTFQMDHRRLWRVPLAAAAVGILVAGGALAIRYFSADTTRASVVEPMREYATASGQRITFQLADGTRLILAPASRLRVPVTYGRGVREVYLDGEAFFDVVHDTNRPFRVLAKGAVVEDLGTRFDMRAYADDAVVTVAVAEGMVALARGGAVAGARARGDVAQGVILRQGELGTLAPNGQVTTDTGAVVQAHLRRAEGRLWFIETPLLEVARTVSRWYDLDVRIEGTTLATRTMTAEFAAQSPDEVVRALALALDARVTQMGRIVTLHPKS